MKIKEQTIQELDSLPPSDLLMVYELLLSLKAKAQKKVENKTPPVYEQVREALSGCRGSFSEDISRGREEGISGCAAQW